MDFRTIDLKDGGGFSSSLRDLLGIANRDDFALCISSCIWGEVLACPDLADVFLPTGTVEDVMEGFFGKVFSHEIYTDAWCGDGHRAFWPRELWLAPRAMVRAVIKGKSPRIEILQIFAKEPGVVRGLLPESWARCFHLDIDTSL